MKKTQYDMKRVALAIVFVAVSATIIAVHTSSLSAFQLPQPAPTHINQDCISLGFCTTNSMNANAGSGPGGNFRGYM